MFDWLIRVLFHRKPKTVRLSPECTWVMKTDGEVIEMDHPKNGRKSISLADLRAFYVDTNDSGPMGIDVWFILIGPSEEADLVFSQGATGEDKILEILFKLPGFNHEAFIGAMSCVENKRFECWSREA